MSGDVQPRKRKDKKRKKDDLGIEEPRGTAAALGDGDVFMHSHHDHGTGGHWCAKIIFFSLLAVLLTLIGLIILENRGLSELEANAVESRYSGVLEGWLEDAPDDDHHDEHTLELNHHEDDDDDDDHHEVNQLEDEDEDESHEIDEDNENDDEHDEDDHDDDDDDDDENDEDHDEDDEEHGGDDDAQRDDDDDEENDNDNDEEDEQLDNDDNDEDEDLDDNNVDVGEKDSNEDDDDELHDDEDNNDDDNEQDDEDDDDALNFDDDNEDKSAEQDNEDEDKYYSRYEVNENEEGNDESNENDNIFNDSVENKNDDDENESLEDKENEDDDEHEEEGNDEDDGEVEKLEKEEPDEDPISTELPALPEDDDQSKDVDDDDDDDDKHSDKEDDATDAESDHDEDEEFLEDDTDEPPIERITAPAGNPLPEVEEEVSSEQPPDTLAEEEEYEKRQEELRREEEQSSHMWLKLTVGAALLVATHAVMRRATRSSDDADDEEPGSREETPLSDRRLTLIPEEHARHVPVSKLAEEISRPGVDELLKSAASAIKPTLAQNQEDEDDEEEDEKYSDEEEAQEIVISTEDNKELYSDEEEAVADEEYVEEPKQIVKQAPKVVESKPEPASEPEEEGEDDDVEIIDDEQLEEELEEEDEEEISDVDDAELLTRLEAKYGRLPEPERPGQKHYKDGGNSLDDAWPGEPSDAYWRGQLDSAERELLQGSWSAAAERASRAPDCAHARWIAARALDIAAETKRDNKLLSQAIAAYLHLLKMNERLPDKKLLQVAERTLDRIQFRGNYLNAEPVYRLLIRRFPHEPGYRNNLTISFLMANRADLAEETLQETLQRWPNDRLALAHYGFVLKTRHNRYEEAADAFRKALEGDIPGPANEARFYYHYGDSLLLLGRPAEAHEIHKRGAKLGHFLSPAQRSLYNVPRLKSTPWWRIEDTPYSKLAKALEKSWREILKEAEAAKELYEKEKEGLKERGEWSQLDLFVRGREIPKRCERAPVTCSIVKSEIAAAGCRRGQIKFSAMEAGTHVRAHVGPTNCRLRMHLGLSNTKDTYLRVDQEIRQWQEGKTFMFDDSFEHEVWHNGTGTRLVLIVDVWHPDLTPAERRQLPAI